MPFLSSLLQKLRPAAKPLLILVSVTLLYALSTRLNPAQLQEWKETAHPLPFFLVLTLFSLTGAPSTPFLLIAGGTYGPGLALLGTLLSQAAVLVVSCRVAHSSLRPLLERRLRTSRRQLPQIDRRRILRYTLLVRLIPALPSVAKNVLLCLVGIPFPIYFSVSLCMSMLYAAPLIVMGDSIFEPDPALLIASLLAVLVLAMLTPLLSKRLRSAFPRTSRRTAGPAPHRGARFSPPDPPPD